MHVFLTDSLMMNFIKKATLIYTLLTLTIGASAQNGVNSPYSRYGFGLLSERAMGFNKAMGGVSLGFRDGQEINPANPASYSAVDSLTALFDLGATFQASNFKMGNLSQNTRNCTFDYFAYSFRATKGLGITFSFLPFSKINYSFASDKKAVENNQDITHSYTYTGTGGLRQIMLGTGWQIFKPLSVGLNVGFLWGDYEHKMTNTTSSSTAYSMRRTYSARINTYTLDADVQYTVDLSKDNKLTIGATYAFGHSMGGDAVRNTATVSSTQENSTDVILEKAFELPHSFGLGVTFYNSKKIRAGVDATWERWSKVVFPIAENYEDYDGIKTWTRHEGVLNDRLKFSGGFEYTPDSESASFLKRSKYKIGGYYSRSYANANESNNLALKKPTEFGVSAGFTIPIRNRNLFYSAPKLNVAFSWVHTNIPYYSNSTSQAGTLKENYFRISLGLTVSERWFYKWKVQ